MIQSDRKCLNWVKMPTSSAIPIFVLKERSDFGPI